MLLQYLRRLYSLDTLDTRFTDSTTNSPNPSTADKGARTDPARPSLSELSYNHAVGNGAGQNESSAVSLLSEWRALGFLMYWVILPGALFMMVKSVYEISIRERSLQIMDCAPKDEG